MKPWDVAIIGGGILGTCTAYWLSTQYEARIAVIEQESDVGEHASRRNTGVVHRPFYLHPEKSKLFARSSLLSYELWRKYAEKRGLPWRVVGTLKLAVREEDVDHLQNYVEWAKTNGMEENEVELLDAREVAALEPHVKCTAAFHADKETAVDFGAFTRELRKDVESNGVRFLLGRRVRSLSPIDDEVEMDVAGSRRPHRAKYVINCAGGDAVDLAHSLGVGRELTDLHFRGEYWKVGAGFNHLAGMNIYTVPRHPEFPFLDPHWIVRASGEREIGPNAVPVAGPRTYDGFFESPQALLHKLWEPPLNSKARLLVSPTFLSLALEEALGSISRTSLATRVRRFLPDFREEMLVDRGTAGVRSAIIDQSGNFIKEVVELSGHSSTHVLNYNSPGATGAPVYTATLVERLKEEARLDHLKMRTAAIEEPWDLDDLATAFEYGEAE